MNARIKTCVVVILLSIADISFLRCAEVKRRITMSFHSAPWDVVISQLASSAELSFSPQSTPPGTFSYIAEHQLSVSEAIDVVNNYLLVKGYTLIRNHGTLVLIKYDGEEGARILRGLLEETPPDRLEKRGNYEITRTRFTLEYVDAIEVDDQIRELLTPVGSLIVLPRVGEVIVTETGGALRLIKKIIDKLESAAEEQHSTELKAFRLRAATSVEFLAIARPLLSIGDGQWASRDESIRLSSDADGRTIFAAGNEDKLRLVKQIVANLNASESDSRSSFPSESLQFISHPVADADPDAVIRVLQTMFSGEPAIRLEIDRSTGRIMALATPMEHRSIRATITEMEQYPEKLEVIPVNGIEPSAAISLVEKLFSTSQMPPLVDGTHHPPQLVVRGTQTQIHQIRNLLNDIGVSKQHGAEDAKRLGNVRMIPMADEFIDVAIEMIEQSWLGADHRIRVIDLNRRCKVITLRPQVSDERANIRPPRPVPTEDDTVDVGGDVETVTVSHPNVSDTRPKIVISRTPTGLMLMSPDRGALDSFESFFQKIAGSFENQTKFHLAYLQYVEAETAKELLTDILAGVTTPISATIPVSASPPNVSIRADRAGNLANSPNVNELVGKVGMSTNSDPLHIVADNRLNALVIQGTGAEIQNVQQLLEVIDRDTGPEEVFTTPQPRFIRVYNSSAESAAKVVREVFADRLYTATSNGGNPSAAAGQASNEKARERKRPPGRRQEEATYTHSKMTLGVDTENNALVVVASNSLFHRVEMVVREIDREAASKGPQSYSISTLKSVNVLNIKQALSVFGDQVTFSERTAKSIEPDMPSKSTQQNSK